MGLMFIEPIIFDRPTTQKGSDKKKHKIKPHHLLHLNPLAITQMTSFMKNRMNLKDWKVKAKSFIFRV